MTPLKARPTSHLAVVSLSHHLDLSCCAASTVRDVHDDVMSSVLLLYGFSKRIVFGDLLVPPPIPAGGNR